MRGRIEIGDEILGMFSEPEGSYIKGTLVSIPLQDGDCWTISNEHGVYHFGRVLFVERVPELQTRQ